MSRIAEVLQEIVHLEDTFVGYIATTIEGEEVWDLPPEALGVPDRRRYVRDILFDADHGDHARETDRAEVVQRDGVFEKHGLD